jgi:hypothetical protein
MLELLQGLLTSMALTADVNYEVFGHTNILEIEAGAADTLYKGALVNVGTDGYLKVAADVASEVPIGVVVKQHVADGSTHAKVQVETGRIWVGHSGAAQTDVGAFFYATADDTLADSASNVGPAGLCVGWKSGYVLIDFNIKALS